VAGTLGENTEVKEFLVIRSSGRVEGHVNCGDVEVEKGAVLAGGIFSVYTSGEVVPVNDNDRAPAGAAPNDPEHEGRTLSAAE